MIYDGSCREESVGDVVHRSSGRRREWGGQRFSEYGVDSNGRGNYLIQPFYEVKQGDLKIGVPINIKAICERWVEMGTNKC